MLCKLRVCLFVLILSVSGLVFLTTTPANAECPEGMISYWILDETSGDTYEDFVNGNDGVGNASPTSVSEGKVNGAQGFDGSTTGIDVEPDVSFDWGMNESFSIEYWVKAGLLSPVSSAEVVVGRDDTIDPSKLHWWTGLRRDGRAQFTLIATNGDGEAEAGDVRGAHDLRDGAWHHVVAVRDAATGENRIYVDGAIDSSNAIVSITYNAGFESATAKLNIGYLERKNNSNRHRFEGTLDEVAIYNRVLTPAEISEHYNAGMSYCGDSYNLTVHTDGGAGTGTVNPAGGVYRDGTTVLLTADPATGSAFFEWNTGGDLSGHSNPAIIAMNADKTVTAAFEPDGDADGVSDLEESGPDGTDPNYSGNGEDLNPDWQEANVTSMRTHDGKSYVTLEVDLPATLSDCRTVPPPPGGPAGVLFPYGFFGFTVKNAAAAPNETTVKLYLPGATTTYYKYGPTPTDASDHWYEFLFDDPPGEPTGAEINGNIATLRFVDGERGDDVLGDDNMIIDQGGPGAPPGGGATPVGGGGGGGGCFISNVERAVRR